MMFVLLMCIVGSRSQNTESWSTTTNAYNVLFDAVDYPKAGDLPTLNHKIFKGERVTIREHPYAVSVRRQFVHHVTGTLISTNLVITVAHALYRAPIHELGVVAGENYSDRGSMLHTAILLVLHQDFDPYTLRADLALLRLYEQVAHRGSIKPIAMISTSVPLTDNMAFVTGWGRCDVTGEEICLPRSSIYHPKEYIDPMLRTVRFKIYIPNFYCDGYKQHDITLDAGMLCVGDAREEYPVASCLAAPGAPLVVNGRLAGVQSWGFGCGYSRDLPLIYTNIQYYQPWILNNVNILHSLTKENFTQLFEATKAYILSVWFTETRIRKPTVPKDFPLELQQTDLDATLAKLKGSPYDIRDFMDSGIYHGAKLKMYNAITLRGKYLKGISKARLQINKPLPFIEHNWTLDYEED